MIGNFKKFFRLFNKREKINSLILLFLIIVGGFVETLGIGVILPFMTVLLNQNSAVKYPILRELSEIPWIGGYRRFIVLMCMLLIFIFIVKSLYMFFLIYLQNRFARNRQVELSKKLFQAYLQKPYEYFFKKNTAELQRNVNNLVGAVVNGMFMTGLSLLTELVIIVFILVLLLLVDPVSSIFIMIVLGGVAVLFYSVLKNKLDRSAKKNNKSGIQMVKLVNEGLGSIKDTKALGREYNFLSNFSMHGKIFARQIAFYNLCQQAPKLLIETIAVSGIVIIVVINALRNPDMNASLPVIALFGMAAIRIMPSMSRIINYITAIRFNSVYFHNIYDDLLDAVQGENSNLNDNGISRLKFENKIEVKDLTYRYPETEDIVLDHINLSIEKGETVGIMGSSGAGKTTFADILLGLLCPEKGSILVDGVNINENIKGWRKSIGYVPQNIFIIDGTITENVAFGVPDNKVDIERIWKTLEMTNLKIFVDALEEKLGTRLGEGGIRLSGGQRQRLGIARALYNNPELLVLDEATSSLDMENEKIISDAINAIGKTKTMIIIAHRLNTLEKCSVIYKVDSGKMVKTSLCGERSEDND